MVARDVVVEPKHRTSATALIAFPKSNRRTARGLVRAGQSDPGLDQVKKDTETDERRQVDDLLTRTQSDQSQHATDADDGGSPEEAEVQGCSGQRNASASNHP